MSWIILEGLDRTGKSTIAELYKSKGYEVVHMSAPSKEYLKEGYAGPLYIDEILEMYMEHDAKDVVFDRSPYGEEVWPHVYNRKVQLSDDDFDILREFEDKNQVQRILMIDPNAKEHWERCVANSEPLNFQQFKVASALFNKMAHKYNFIPQQLGDFDVQTETPKQDLPLKKSSGDVPQEGTQPIGTDKFNKTSSNIDDLSTATQKTISGKSQEQEKLEKANAINSILAKRIVRQKGVIFDKLESDIKIFLQEQLSVILGSDSNKPSLSKEEVQLLKLYCSRIIEKQKSLGS